jgi:DNA-binding transcriptional MerR regulator
MIKYSIRDLEKISGIKAHTVRIWEKRYKLFTPERTDTNIRFYSDTDLKKLLNISILNRYGYKISKIAKLSIEELNDKVLDLAHQIDDSDKTIESLVLAVIEFDEERIEKLVNRAIVKYGFEEAFLKNIFPFIQKIDLLWQVGTINFTHKHFVNCIIRQIVVIAIDNINRKSFSDSKCVVLFLPDNETNELGLLFYHYFFKKKGYKVIYLGQSTQLSDLRILVDNLKPAYLLTTFMSSLLKLDIEDYVENLSTLFKEVTIYIDGLYWRDKSSKAYTNIVKIDDFDEFKKLFEPK